MASETLVGCGGVPWERLVPGNALARSGGPHSWRGCTIQWNMTRPPPVDWRAVLGAQPPRDAPCVARALAPLPSDACLHPPTSRYRRDLTTVHNSPHKVRNTFL
ncbi:unnamed protein product [Arctia plantaginis]|uniref:Uncharacterized protein n=1 Tax=Arctia plantaginis TaxID=874455 RepID=A0A8S0Z5W8_ARCPL|nr:unnamed protein product [Arctia plantaginis]CAB3228159.1 unnamed protein product [Arctia plantaginis]